MKYGSLFSGAGGLDRAVEEVFGASPAFVADVCGEPDPKKRTAKNWPHKTPCASPCTILAHRFPDTPNLGDVSAIDWTPWVGLIEILCAGFPCQDVSTAGKRAGLSDGTRTGLWSEVVRAIRSLQPRLVVLENVPGIFTAPASGDVEPCPWCLGDGTDEPPLRALDAVLADIAEIGFDAEWVTVPASGVGAPHKRERWFLLAHPSGQPWSFDNRDTEAPAHSEGIGRSEGWAEPTRVIGRPDAAQRGHEDVTLLPTPVTEPDTGNGHARNLGKEIRLLKTPTSQLSVNGGSQHPDKRTAGGHGPTLADEVEHLLPTPAVNDMGEGKTVDAWDAWDAWTDSMRERHGNGNGHGKSLAIEAQRLLPTPNAADGSGSGRHSSPGHQSTLPGEVRLLGTPRASEYKGTGPVGSASHQHRLDRGYLDAQVALLPTVVVNRQSNGYGPNLGEALARFGDYAPAIARWESVLGRPAPEPTEPTGRDGAHRLSPRFTEWMMGWPDGWVTDVPGITRSQALKACGNGVVILQAVEALWWLLVRVESEAAV